MIHLLSVIFFAYDPKKEINSTLSELADDSNLPQLTYVKKPYKGVSTGKKHRQFWDEKKESIILQVCTCIYNLQ